MKSLIFIIIFVFLLSGCASSRQNYLGDKTYYDLKTAINKPDIVWTIRPGTPLKINISTSSPNIILDDARGKFEIFEISGNKDQNYWISATALCDCLGFRKQSIVPVAYLLDKNGGIVSTGGPHGGTFQYVSGKFPESGNFYFLVIADNRLDGEKIGQLSGPMVVGGSVGLADVGFSLSARTTGPAIVNWEKK